MLNCPYCNRKLPTWLRGMELCECGKVFSLEEAHAGLVEVKEDDKLQ